MNVPDETLLVRGVRKSYGELVALQEVSLGIQPGSVLALLGPNGAGKTTLLSIIAGLLAPDQGSVVIAGHDMAVDSRTAHALLGFAPQELGLYQHLSVNANLRFFGRMFGLARGRLSRRITEVAEALQFEDLLPRRVADLSGGQQRRVHTAAALLHKPALLLLDEPTAGVDVQSRVAMLDFVKQVAQAGTAICYTTHYLEEIERLDVPVVILDRGKVVTRGLPQELISEHGGGSMVEVRFVAEVPVHLLDIPGAQATGSTLRIPSESRDGTLQQTLATVSHIADAVMSVEIVRPSLETVYLRLVGGQAPSDAKPQQTLTPEAVR